jgi:hypothetical protein
VINYGCSVEGGDVAASLSASSFASSSSRLALSAAVPTLI